MTLTAQQDEKSVSDRGNLARRNNIINWLISEYLDYLTRADFFAPALECGYARNQSWLTVIESIGNALRRHYLPVESF